jgi:hypothetical protein
MPSSRRLLPESLAESEAVGEARPPRSVARISGVPGAVVGVCAEASMVLRNRRSCICSLRLIVPWWRRSEGRWCL